MRTKTQISPDISSLKAKRDARDDFLEVCKVSREKVEPITEGDIEMYKIQYHDFLALWRYQHDVSRHEHQQKDIMFLAVPAKFDISSVFKTWFGNLSGNDPAYKKTDPTCLFKYWTKSEMKDIAGKFLVKWTVQFEGKSV